jgi:hypothetical protein
MIEHKVHPAADLFPMMEKEALKDLAANIKENGQRFPITFWKKTGELLDGRNRLAACLALGLKAKTDLYEGDDPISFIVSANIHRRHLTATQKRELVGKLLELNPEKSDRQIASTAKVDHKTVAKERRKKAGRGEIPHQTKRTDARGRKQPASKPKAAFIPTPKELESALTTNQPDTALRKVANFAISTLSKDSALALADFKYAVGHYVPKLSADDLKEARAYFQDRAEAREKANGARATGSAEQSVEERKALNTKLAEQEECTPTQ